MLFLPGNPGAGDDEGQDIRSNEGAARAAARIAGLKSLAGMVILLPQGETDSSASMEDVSRLLRGFFILLQAFLQAPGKKFVVLIHSGEENETPARLLAEGMLGLFLSAAQEYPAVQFRTLAIGSDTDLRAALRDALDRGYPMVEMAHRAWQGFYLGGAHRAVALYESGRSRSAPWRRGRHVRRRNRDRRPPGPQSCALSAPPGLSGEDVSHARMSGQSRSAIRLQGLADDNRAAGNCPDPGGSARRRDRGLLPYLRCR